MKNEYGQVTVFTGDGKGKTTSALGEGLQYWVDGKKVLVLQFIKGQNVYGEYMAAKKLAPNFTIKRLGLGFVRFANEETIKKHIKAAQLALKEAEECIVSEQYQLIILDEILYCIKFGLIQEKNVIDLIKIKPQGTNIILTGRDAPLGVKDNADRVIEFVNIKHPIEKGIKAQKGIEF